MTRTLMPALFSRTLRRLHRLEYGDAAADQRDVGAGVHFHGLPDFESVFIGRIAVGLEAAPDADVHRAGTIHTGPDGIGAFDAVGRNDHRHIGHRAGDGDVLRALMRGPRLPEGNAAVGRDNLDVEILIADVGPDLFGRPHGGEHGHRRHEGNQTGLGKACGHAEHVLLRDAGIEKTIRKFCSEFADLG